jgi:hypothetical protein
VQCAPWCAISADTCWCPASARLDDHDVRCRAAVETTDSRSQCGVVGRANLSVLIVKVHPALRIASRAALQTVGLAFCIIVYDGRSLVSLRLLSLITADRPLDARYLEPTIPTCCPALAGGHSIIFFWK